MTAYLTTYRQSSLYIIILIASLFVIANIFFGVFVGFAQQATTSKIIDIGLDLQSSIDAQRGYMSILQEHALSLFSRLAVLLIVFYVVLVAVTYILLPILGRIHNKRAIFDLKTIAKVTAQSFFLIVAARIILFLINLPLISVFQRNALAEVGFNLFSMLLLALTITYFFLNLNKLFENKQAMTMSKWLLFAGIVFVFMVIDYVLLSNIQIVATTAIGAVDVLSIIISLIGLSILAIEATR